MQVFMCSPVSFNPKANSPLSKNPAFASTHIKMKPVDALAILDRVFGHGNPGADDVERALPPLIFLVSKLKGQAIERARRYIDRAVADLGEANSVYKNTKLDVQQAGKKALGKPKKKS